MKSCRFKIVLLGDATVGKSSIAERFYRGTFSNFKDSTIGAAYFMINKNNRRIDIWDTAGQERYQSLVSMYYRDADVILFVFDVTNIDSLSKLKVYMNKLKEERKDNYLLYIIGNKRDLLNTDKFEQLELEIQDRVPKDNITKIFYVSAKTNENVESLLEEIISAVDKLPTKDATKHDLIDLNEKPKNWYSCYCY